MSNPMIPQFGIIGPSKNPYSGTICLPQVPLPANASVKAGDNATIQVVELAVHGAALYSCVDITFVEDNDPRLAIVNETNCSEEILNLLSYCFHSGIINLPNSQVDPAESTGRPHLIRIVSSTGNASQIAQGDQRTVDNLRVCQI
ncbi:MAG: hypothetical protein STHCBS139747_000099 [Sporothrix thermara]